MATLDLYSWRTHPVTGLCPNPFKPRTQFSGPHRSRAKLRVKSDNLGGRRLLSDGGAEKGPVIWLRASGRVSD